MSKGQVKHFQLWAKKSADIISHPISRNMCKIRSEMGIVVELNSQGLGGFQEQVV